MATNPSLEDHRDRVKKIYENKLNSMEGSNSQEVLNLLSNIFSDVGDGFIDKLISRDNYLLFSITKLNFGGVTRNIGFGILGKVYAPDYDELAGLLNAKGVNMQNTDQLANAKESDLNPSLGLKKDSPIPLVSNKEEEVLRIRSLFKKANSNSTLQNSYKISCSNEYAYNKTTLRKYVMGNSVSKISIDFAYIGDTKKFIEFYFNDGMLYFIYQVEDFADQFNGELIKSETRIYVSNDNVIKYLIGKDELREINKLTYNQNSVEYKIYRESNQGNLKDLVCSYFQD
jgi:hypothetical protein